MRDLLIVVIIGLVLGYAADNYWYNGQYTAELSSMFSQILAHFR